MKIERNLQWNKLFWIKVKLNFQLFTFLIHLFELITKISPWKTEPLTIHACRLPRIFEDIWPQELWHYFESHQVIFRIPLIDDNFNRDEILWFIDQMKHKAQSLLKKQNCSQILSKISLYTISMLKRITWRRKDSQAIGIISGTNSLYLWCSCSW